MTLETYAQRKRRLERAGKPEVYIYDQAPAQLRHQIGISLQEGLGEYEMRDPYHNDGEGPTNEQAYECWREIDRACRKEVFPYLDYVGEENFMRRVLAAIKGVEEIDEWISIIGLCCKMLAHLIDREHKYADRSTSDAAEFALAEINRRFEQHAIGYQFENGEIVRKDSQLMHAEVIKPALSLLGAPEFEKANAEFMTAHRHYRNGEYKDAVTAANRAFETMLKAICDLEGWNYEKGHRAGELVTVVSKNGLFTHDFDRGLTAYVAMLKTGLPDVRNHGGGHGEGLAAKTVTAEIARYAINLTASNIRFLGESFTSFRTAKRGA